MTTSLVANGNGALAIDDKSLLALVTDGDCGRLNEAQKLAYYRARCEAAGLDYRAQPFQYVKLNNKLVLYALKAASDQLAAKHGIRVHIVSQETTADGIRVVTVRAITRDGREADDIGAVTVKSLTGDALANALMKAATKAKRRAILSACGLGMLDETEIETIPKAQPIRGAIPDDKSQGGPVGLLGRVNPADATAAGRSDQSLTETQSVEPAPATDLHSDVDPQEALAAKLIEACEAGFPSKEARFAWWAGHLNQINSLPKEFARAVVKAYDATRGS